MHYIFGGERISSESRVQVTDSTALFFPVSSACNKHSVSGVGQFCAEGVED